MDTGDIGWIAPHHSRGRSRRCGGVIVLEGRAKDTIVLSTGTLKAQKSLSTLPNKSFHFYPYSYACFQILLACFPFEPRLLGHSFIDLLNMFGEL